jgi:hypothetical protein
MSVIFTSCHLLRIPSWWSPLRKRSSVNIHIFLFCDLSVDSTCEDNTGHFSVLFCWIWWVLAMLWLTLLCEIKDILDCKTKLCFKKKKERKNRKAQFLVSQVALFPLTSMSTLFKRNLTNSCIQYPDLETEWFQHPEIVFSLCPCDSDLFMTCHPRW